MVTEEISKSQYPLGAKNGVLDWVFKLGFDCVLDSKNRKFYRTLRIGSNVYQGSGVGLLSPQPIIGAFAFSRIKREESYHEMHHLLTVKTLVGTPFSPLKQEDLISLIKAKAEENK